MSEELFFVGLLVAAAVSTTAAVIAGLGWRRAARRADRLEEHLLRHSSSLPRSGTPDAIALQVEGLAAQIDRVAEGQEFLARIIGERPRPVRTDSSPNEGRVRTPH